MSHALAIAAQFGIPFCIFGSTLAIILVRAGALEDQLFADANPREAQLYREEA